MILERTAYRLPIAGGSPSLLRLVPLGLGISVVPLDTAVNIAFPDITGSFGLPIPMIQWVVICYVLTHAGLMLAFGRVGDIWGHARVFRAGLVWNIAAFLLCAAAPSFGLLLFFRFLQGIGAGLIISCAPALVTSLYPGSAAQPRPRHLHADVRDRLGGRAADRRRAGRALGLACGVLVPRADRADRPVAAARAAARRSRRTGGSSASTSPGRCCWRRVWRRCCSRSTRCRGCGTGICWLSCCSRPPASASSRSSGGRPAPQQPVVQVALFRHAAFAIINAASCLLYLVTFSVMLISPYFLVHHTGLSLPQAGMVLASGFVAMALTSPLGRQDRGAVRGRARSRRSERWRSASGCSRSATGSPTPPRR